MIFKVSFTASVSAYLEEPDGLSTYMDWIVNRYKGILSLLYDSADVHSERYTARSRDIDFHKDTVFGCDISFYIRIDNLEVFFLVRNILESFHSLTAYLFDKLEISPLAFDPKPGALPISPEGDQ